MRMPYSYPQSRPQRPAASDYAPFEVRRYGRHWEVRDATGELVCLTVYRRGAAEVIRRLKLSQEAVDPSSSTPPSAIGAGYRSRRELRSAPCSETT